MLSTVGIHTGTSCAAVSYPLLRYLGVVVTIKQSLRVNRGTTGDAILHAHRVLLDPVAEYRLFSRVDRGATPCRSGARTRGVAWSIIITLSCKVRVEHGRVLFRLNSVPWQHDDYWKWYGWEVIKGRESQKVVPVSSSNRSSPVVAMVHSASSILLFGAALLSATYAIGPDCVDGPLKDNKICDVNAPPTERAAALVAAMETAEKLDNLMR